MVNIMTVYFKIQEVNKTVNTSLSAFQTFKIYQFSANTSKFTLPLITSGTISKCERDGINAVLKLILQCSVMALLLFKRSVREHANSGGNDNLKLSVRGQPPCSVGLMTYETGKDHW